MRPATSASAGDSGEPQDDHIGSVIRGISQGARGITCICRFPNGKIYRRRAFPLVHSQQSFIEPSHAHINTCLDYLPIIVDHFHIRAHQPFQRRRSQPVNSQFTTPSNPPKPRISLPRVVATLPCLCLGRLPKENAGIIGCN